MFVRLPSTCGLRVADRRDLIVATYSSDCGTGEDATVIVCTGRACGAGAAVTALWHAVKPNATRKERRTRSEDQACFSNGDPLCFIPAWPVSQYIPLGRYYLRIEGESRPVLRSNPYNPSFFELQTAEHSSQHI